MAKMPPRSIYAVMQHGEGWAVEHEGAFTDPCATRDEAQVCALRRARAASATGVLTQVVIQGEYGYFAANRQRADALAIVVEPT
jgi:hypothetical protein